MKYRTVNTAAGWIVQNTITYSVVAGPYSSENQAKGVVNKLVGVVKPLVKEAEKLLISNLNYAGDK